MLAPRAYTICCIRTARVVFRDPTSVMLPIEAMPVRYRPTVLEALANHAESAFPAEACGLLAGSRSGDQITVTDYYPLPNHATDPRRAFRIDPLAFLGIDKATAGSIVGVFHSHPGGSTAPSSSDLLAAWPEHIQAICTVDTGGAGPPNWFDHRGKPLRCAGAPRPLQLPNSVEAALG